MKFIASHSLPSNPTPFLLKKVTIHTNIDIGCATIPENQVLLIYLFTKNGLRNIYRLQFFIICFSLVSIKKSEKITNCDIRRRQLHNTTLIVNKLTRCAHNIQKHSLGNNSSTITGVMIPVGMSMLICVHYYFPKIWIWQEIKVGH